MSVEWAGRAAHWVRAAHEAAADVRTLPTSGAKTPIFAVDLRSREDSADARKTGTVVAFDAAAQDSRGSHRRLFVTYVRAMRPLVATGPVAHDKAATPAGDSVRSMAGVVELSLLLPESWFADLVDEAEALGMTVGRLLRRLVADHLVEPSNRPEATWEPGPTTCEGACP